MPVVISDAYDDYIPLFDTFLQLEDYGIRIPERDFLRNPIQTLNDAITSLLTNPHELQKKIDGLALVQRIIVLEDPQPLFVNAFVKETIAVQTTTTTRRRRQQ